MFRVMVPSMFHGNILHYARKGRAHKTLTAAVKLAQRQRDAYVIDDRGVLVDYPTKLSISNIIKEYKRIRAKSS